MSIPAPILDDRSYEQLRDALVRRIPVYNPEWTDHNASDPGITLIELFAFLGENLLFRFNQIPEATKIAFLNLLRIPRRPAQPARSLLTLLTDEPGGIRVDAGTEARAGDVVFETGVEVRAWPLQALAVAKRVADPPDEATEPEVADYAERILDAVQLAAGEVPAFYENAEVAPDGQGEPVDFGETVDCTVWIALLSEDGADVEELRGQILNLGWVPTPEVPVFEDTKPEDACPAGTRPGSASSIDWEVSTGEVVQGQPRYARCKLVADSTAGLLREGIVRLELPDRPLGPLNSAAEDPDLPGTRDFPPVLDEERQARVMFWIRARHMDADRRFGSVWFVGANATDVTQQQTAGAEFLGTGSGQPNQSYSLIQPNVVHDSVALQVEGPDGWSEWQKVEGFHASHADSRHFLVDLEAGIIRFGNGLQGRAPQLGERIRVTSYMYGGGRQGNVAADAIDRVARDGVEVVHSIPGHEGGDAETVEEALDRIPGELRRRDRAVTRDDFQELALATPGVNVIRAETLPRFYPPTRESEAAGVVSVMIWPANDAEHPSAPRPDRNMREAVCAYLDERRLITTELYVIPPSYRQVAVTVGVRVKPGYGVDAVRRWVELVLRQYLAPVPPHGPDGHGWPLGRRVHGPELEAAALQVEGVQFLEDLKVGERRASGDFVEGTVVLEDWEVPELVAIGVVEGAELPPLGESGRPPGADVVAIPVPILRDEC